MPGASVASSVSGLTNTILGAGMLALPHAFSEMGWLLGSILTLLCAASTLLGLYLLKLSTIKMGGAKSFFDLGHRILPKYVWAFDALISFKCFGVTISYLIICGNLMPQVMKSLVHAFGSDASQLPTILESKVFWILVLLALLSPMCYVRELHSMKLIGYLNIGAVGYLLLILTYFAISPHANAQLPPAGELHAIRWGMGMVRTFPILVFAYTCAQNIISVYNELQDSTLERSNLVNVVSIGFSAITYLFVGLIGYLTFGSSVADNIIAMYPDQGLFVCIGKICVIILTLSSYPVQLYPSRASFISLIQTYVFWRTRISTAPDEHSSLVDRESQSPANVWPVTEWRWRIITTVLIVVGVIIAVCVDNLSVVLGFVGAIGGTTVSFILPSLIYLHLFHEESHSTMYILSLVLGGVRFCSIYNLTLTVGCDRACCFTCCKLLQSRSLNFQTCMSKDLENPFAVVGAQCFQLIRVPREQQPGIT